MKTFSLEKEEVYQNKENKKVNEIIEQMEKISPIIKNTTISRKIEDIGLIECNDDSENFDSENEDELKLIKNEENLEDENKIKNEHLNNTFSFNKKEFNKTNRIGMIYDYFLSTSIYLQNLPETTEIVYKNNLLNNSHNYILKKKQDCKNEVNNNNEINNKVNNLSGDESYNFNLTSTKIFVNKKDELNEINKSNEINNNKEELIEIDNNNILNYNFGSLLNVKENNKCFTKKNLSAPCYIPINMRQSNKINNNINMDPKNYIIEMFGKKGWICNTCLNFNYESRTKCNRCEEIKNPMSIEEINKRKEEKEKKKFKNKNEKKTDWMCINCRNFNYGFRKKCNICQIERQDYFPKVIIPPQSKKENPDIYKNFYNYISPLYENLYLNNNYNCQNFPIFIDYNQNK